MQYQTHHQNPLQTRVKQLQADKRQLSKAIDELNTCYQQKISLLESTINQQQQAYEELLEWKQTYVNRNLFEVEKYEIEIKRMIETLDNAHKHFESDKSEYERIIMDQRREIEELREENEALSEFNTQNQSKIQEMVRTYTEEIDKLKEELKVLREESIYSQDASEAMPDRTHYNNTENIHPNQKYSQTNQFLDPALSKCSVNTIE